ncbi:nuclear transport factor 2 family protein [Sphingomonas sp.]|uniref:nuclear transport factor 2 family protein n=1 Tax=Sphingomonas sp. TaxID=28214 RepID=UPI0025F78BCE|nr:nuclear transport factor 2 family protein [Sphingomonas sp.]
MIQADIGRRTLLAAVAGVAGAVYAGVARGAPPVGARTSPRQAWAHLDGKIALRGNRPPVADAIDMLMIQEAFGRYGIAYDEGRDAVLAGLFTEDVVVDVAEGSAKPFQSVKGHAAVMHNFTSAFSQQRDQRRHCFSNVLVEEVTGDVATALAYAIVTVAADGLTLGATVIYTTRLRKQDGLWRFAYMFIGMDAYTTPKPKV